MKQNNLIEVFSKQGVLELIDERINFNDLEWHEHPKFSGVFLKHLITGQQTGNQFSYHLVKIEANKKIGLHVHETQLETHEVIYGVGQAINAGQKISYQPGIITIFNKNIEHEVIAGEQGLYLFAKFMPALL